MAADFKDYYAILGVSRTASQDDIRRAFRTLARKHHPDVAADKKTAGAKFAEINEANEVLSDPDKRKKYDTYGADWEHGPPQPPPGAAAGGGTDFQFTGTGFSDFFEQMFGGRGGGGVGGAPRGGFGGGDFVQRGRDVEAEIMVPLADALRGVVRDVSLRRLAFCEACHGSGQVGGQPCARCGGKRRVEKTETYQVKIPAGVYEGQMIRLAGQGEQGEGGRLSGDLFLRVRFARLAEHRIEGDDLFYDLDLPPWDAVLGTTVVVPLLDGRADLKIPAGSNSGRKLRLRGEGLPRRGGGRGDLLVVVNIQLPPQVDQAQRALWEQLRLAAKTKEGKTS